MDGGRGDARRGCLYVLYCWAGLGGAGYGFGDDFGAPATVVSAVGEGYVVFPFGALWVVSV